MVETYILSSTDAVGIIGVLAWSACVREGRRRFVATKANQNAMMRAMQDDEYQELHEVIEHMNGREEQTCGRAQSSATSDV